MGNDKRAHGIRDSSPTRDMDNRVSSVCGVVCRPRTWNGPTNRSIDPTICIRDSYFQKFIMKLNRLETLISKAEEQWVVSFNTPGTLHQVPI